MDSVTGRGATTTNAVTVGNLTSTGIDDNATSTAITIDSSQNVSIAGQVTATNAVLEGTDDPILTLRSTDDGPLYMEFERGTDRHAYMGFGGTGDIFRIWNEESAGLIQLATNNTEAVRIDENQNTFLYGDLTTVGNFTSTGIDDNATSTAITIDASENVGINTNAPNVPLEVASQTPDSVSPFIRISSDTTADGYAYSAIAHGRVAGNLLLAADAGNNLADSYMQFTVDGTDRMKIDAAGTVKFYNAIEEAQYSLTGTAIDPSNGTIQYKTLGANTTFTESLADGEFVTLMINDGAGYTITWPTTTWVGGSAPTLETSGYNIIELWHVNGTLYGAFVGAA